MLTPFGIAQGEKEGQKVAKKVGKVAAARRR
jgi:hypothetical protein